MRYALAFILAILLLAPIAHAQTASSTLPGGFAPRLWLKSTTLKDGDSTKIYTVAYDSSSDAITGDVVFTDNDTPIGSAHFSLAAGSSAIETIKWSASTGTHVLGAALANVIDTTTNAPAQLSNATIPSITVVVAGPPPPPVEETAALNAATGATNAVSAGAKTALPVVQSVASAAVAIAETVRKTGLADLSAALDSTATNTPHAAHAGGALASVSASGAGRSAELGLQALFGNPAAFYGVLLALFALFFLLLVRHLSSSPR